jgi:hypothetical protein
MIQVDFSISLGQILLLISLAGVVWKLHKLGLTLHVTLWEHDLLWEDFCKRYGIQFKKYRHKINPLEGVYGKSAE